MNTSDPLLDDPRGLAPRPTRRAYRDVLLPRLILPLAWLYALALLPAWGAGRWAREKNSRKSRRVVIESGRIGWGQVFFEELEGSSRDFFGEASVERAIIDRDAPYWPQFAAWSDGSAPTHVVIDVRTPPQSWKASLVDAWRVSWRLHRRGIYPIVVLTDPFYRRQRWHAAVLTAWAGMVITFADDEILRPLFPHSRVRGPLIMPISKKQLGHMEQLFGPGSARRGKECTISFVGNIYPPRSTFLTELASELEKRNLYLSINGDKNNRSNEDYWRALGEADIIVTTTMQGPDRSFIDWNWIRQAVHRYSETFAASTAIVASPVDGSFPPFIPDRDYLEYGSIREAAEAIEKLANDPDLRNHIAENGHRTYAKVVETGSFWRVALGDET